MRPDILPPTIIMTMVSVIMKVLKYLQVMEDVNIGILIPATIPIVKLEFITAMMMKEMDLGIKRPGTIVIAIWWFIFFLLMVELGLGLKRPATLPLSIA